MVVTAAASEIKPGGKKVSIVGPRRAVLVLSSPQKEFNANRVLLLMANFVADQNY
jgi:hypothetical protein